MPEPTDATVGEELKAAVESLSELIDALPEDLGRQALTHPSWVEDRSTSYERLALLGDSVLGLALASELFERFSDQDSGRLTKILNQSVSGSSCSADLKSTRVRAANSIWGPKAAATAEAVRSKPWAR